MHPNLCVVYAVHTLLSKRFENAISQGLKQVFKVWKIFILSFQTYLMFSKHWFSPSQT